MENYIDRHDAYSRYQALREDKEITPCTQPSNYITAVKLRKAVKTLTDMEIEELYNRELSPKSIPRYRAKLIQRINNLLDEHYPEALRLLYTEGNTYAMAFILACGRKKNKKSGEKKGLQ